MLAPRIYEKGTTMTAVEIGQELQRTRHIHLPACLLAPYRPEDNASVADAPTKEYEMPLVAECGIRFQRCGGGRRVIRRSRGNN